LEVYMYVTVLWFLDLVFLFILINTSFSEFVF
jgi:hypothetical protein